MSEPKPAQRLKERKKAPSRGSKPGERRGGGSRKGKPNKVTQNAREAITRLIDGFAPRIEGWIEEVYAEQGAEKAIKCVTDLLEFTIPKLARTEVSGPDGGPQEIRQIVVMADDGKS